MKRNLLITLLFLGSLVWISSSNMYTDGDHSTLKGAGGPPYNTNAPGEKTCSGTEGTSPCHSGSIPDNSGPATCTITSTGGTMYVPGQTYTITCSITHASRTEFGFQASTRIVSSNAKAGNIVVTDGTKTWLHPVTYGSCQTCQFICHKSAGTSFPGKTGTWSFRWQAPSSNVGNCKVYACFNAANNNNTETGDEIYYTSLTLTPSLTAISEQELLANVEVFPNPSQDGQFNISSYLIKVEQVSVYDVNGKFLLQKQLNEDGSFTIDKPAGVYFISLGVGESRVFRKIVIAK